MADRSTMSSTINHNGTSNVHVHNQDIPEIVNDESDIKVDTSSVSTEMLDVMTKYFYLSLLTIISTQLFTASELVLSAGIDHAEKTNLFTYYYTSYKIYHILRQTDSMVTTMYIILSFNFSGKCYDKFCNSCHNLCLSIFKKCIAKDLETRIRATSRSVAGMDNVNKDKERCGSTIEM